MRTIGLITIGQSPRIDVTQDLVKLIPGEIRLVEVGALDDLSREEVIERLSPRPGETVYVTRLRDGSEVKISRERIIELMRDKIRVLESKGAEVIGVLCSGEFPEFESNVPIVYPDRILKGIVSSISFKGRSLVLIPAEEQVEYAKRKWSSYLRDFDVISISPYTSSPEDFVRLGEKIRERDIRLVVMDCIGYTLEQKRIIREISPKTRVITSRGALARALSELI